MLLKILLPLYRACVTSQFGMITLLLENGIVIGFTRENPEVNRLCLVRSGNLRLEGAHEDPSIADWCSNRPGAFT